MKHWAIVACILLLGCAALFVSERRKVDVPPGPAAVLYLVADTEQELTRMPVRFTRMSDAEEIAAGDQLAKTYQSGRDEKPTSEQIEIEQYIDDVGARVAAKAHRKLPYKFHYIPDNWFFNAFALPGGHVYIGQGLLSLMDSEDELAAVLGHEIEHIDHYHSAERLQQEQALRKIPLGQLFALPIAVFEAGYTKNQELEADREGTQLAFEAGYSATGAIRMFEAFQQTYEQYHSRPKTPQQELTETARETLEGYFRSHPLPSERKAQIEKMIAQQGWTPRAERDLQVAYISWAQKAQTALSAHQYVKAEQLANRSIKIKSGNRRALAVLVQAEFAQANFRGSAERCRQLLDAGQIDLDTARAYAAALAAADRTRAAGEFQKWLNTIRGSRPEGLQVPLAGLSLLAGDAGPARQVTQAARQSLQEQTTAWAPEWLGDLAWWYYLSGDYQTGLDLTNEAVQRRPGEVRLWVQRGWIEIQQRRLADASDSLERDRGLDLTSGEMARAVLHWQEKTGDDVALSVFQQAVSYQPEWLNPQWVKALYSPLVAESIQQMRTETERRKTVALSRPH